MTLRCLLNPWRFRAGNGVTATSNASTSPTGENTMSLITENTAGGEHYAGDRNIALTAGTSYCFSTYVKASQGNRWLYLRTASGTTSGTFFDVTNGKWDSDNFSAPITDRGFESLGNGIYRVWMVFTATNTQSTVIRLQLSQPGQVATYTGDGASGLYLWGAQLEESTFPSSYIKTVASTVTRSPDLWSIASTNTGYQTLADKFKRTVAFEFVPKYTITTGYTDVVRVPGVTNDIICRFITANRLQSFRDAGGTPSITVTPGVLGMVVHVTSGDDCTMYYDGNPSYRAQPPSNTTTKPTYISNSVGSANGKFVYYIRNFRIWHRELTVNQIKGLR
ncbi:phage head spike fiber domain-containing protein [Leclercia adecarboxylata]